MSTHETKNPFLTFLADGLANADSGLGDRSQYIGSSDIGQCLRKGYLSKLIKEEHTLRQLIVFERGHVGEGVIEKALKAKKIPYKTQVEIDVSKLGLDVPFNPHLDFVVESQGQLIVIECKTTASLPEEPRESWVLQTQFQMGFLQEANPDKKVRGYVVAFDLNSGEAREWAMEPNPILFDLAKERGTFLWNALQKGEEPEGEPSDLCAFCSFRHNCTTLRNGAEELPKEIAEMAQKVKSLASAEKEAKTLKDQIKVFMEDAGIKKGTAGDITLSLAHYKGREMINAVKLKQDEPEMYSAYVKIGEPYSVLKII
jgi:CRISPR-associated exonuclease Cas4